MRHLIRIALLALALGALSACSGAAAPSPSPTWTPAPKLTADPESSARRRRAFTVRLEPVPKPASFEGYSLASANLWFLPKASQNEAAVDGWFPYALPAGRYRLVVRQTSGGGSLVSFDELDVAGVK